MSKVFLKQVFKGNRECYELRWWEGPKRMSRTIGWVKIRGKKCDGGKFISRREADARCEDKRTALAAEAERAKRAAEEAAKPKVEPVVVQPNSMTLREFYDGYAGRRRQTEANHRGYLKDAPKLGESTIQGHLMTLTYLRFHFGDDRLVDSISLEDAAQFVERLSRGELDGARKTTQHYDLKDGGIRCHLRNCKAIYKNLMLFGHVPANPFSLFSSKTRTGQDNHYVPLRDFLRLFKASPTPVWGLFFALQRLGGLRREAARMLPWSGMAVDSWGIKHRIGVDWDRRRLMVVGNCKGGDNPHRYREAPIRPWLHRLLRKAYEAGPGRFGHPEEEAKPISGVSYHNLIRIGKHICIDARLKAWPRLFQSLRSSCENDWKALGVPEATYCAWMGHSGKVSREHYVRPLGSEFDFITKVA